MNMNLGALKFINLIYILFFTFTLNAKPIEGNSIEIQILDKITAKVSNINISVGQLVKFESLSIKVYKCYKTSPEEIPEDYVFLKINDQINVDLNDLIYQGWMISSSPAITPLEHPIYDLWIKACKIDVDF